MQGTGGRGHGQGSRPESCFPDSFPSSLCAEGPNYLQAGGDGKQCLDGLADRLSL